MQHFSTLLERYLVMVASLLSVVYSKLHDLHASHSVAIFSSRPLSIVHLPGQVGQRSGSFALWVRRPFPGRSCSFQGTTPKTDLCANRCCVSTFHLRLYPHWSRSGQVWEPSPMTSRACYTLPQLCYSNNRITISNQAKRTRNYSERGSGFPT